MKIRLFTIPVHGYQEETERLNQFLACQRILAVERVLVQDGANSAWSFCISYESSGGEAVPQSQVGKKGQIDYREILNEVDFALFTRLRTIRKELSTAEGVPAYALFTNEQLAEMVTSRATTAAALLKIAGVGDARVAKYGKPFLQLMQDAAPSVPPGDGSVPHAT